MDLDELIGTDVGTILRRLGDAMLADLTEMSVGMSAAVARQIPVISADERLLESLRVSAVAHADLIARALQDGRFHQLSAPPSEGIAFAKMLARRDLPEGVLLRTYRLGAQELLRRVLELIQAVATDTASSSAASAELTSDVLRYLDLVSEKALDAFRDEAAAWHGRSDDPWKAVVTAFLNNTDRAISARIIESDLHYPLAHCDHIALIASGRQHLELARIVVGNLASDMRSPAAPLVVHADSSTTWFWIAVVPTEGKTPDFSLLNQHIDGPSFIYSERFSGADGFRTAHVQTRNVLALSRTYPRPALPQLVAAEAYEFLSVIGATSPAVQEWAVRVLGHLLDPQNRLLLEVAIAYCVNHYSLTLASKALGVHRNTVLNRLGRASDICGYNLHAPNVAVGVALTTASLLHTSGSEDPPRRA